MNPMTDQTELRTIPLALALGVPTGAAAVLAALITVLAGWPVGQGVGLAIAIFMVVVVPWMGFLMLRKLRREEGPPG
jgi:hypothetical protein